MEGIGGIHLHFQGKLIKQHIDITEDFTSEDDNIFSFPPTKAFTERSNPILFNSEYKIQLLVGNPLQPIKCFQLATD